MLTLYIFNITSLIEISTDTNNRTLSQCLNFQDNIQMKLEYNCILKSSSNPNTYSNRTLNWIIRNRQAPPWFIPTTFRRTRNTMRSMFLFHLSNWSWIAVKWQKMFTLRWRPSHENGIKVWLARHVGCVYQLFSDPFFVRRRIDATSLSYTSFIPISVYFA